MRVVKKEDITKPFKTPLGELIYEMIGKPEGMGGTSNHSFVYIVIPSSCSSSAHYHKVPEETYYILKLFIRLNID